MIQSIKTGMPRLAAGLMVLLLGVGVNALAVCDAAFDELLSATTADCVARNDTNCGDIYLPKAHRENIEFMDNGGYARQEGDLEKWSKKRQEQRLDLPIQLRRFDSSSARAETKRMYRARLLYANCMDDEAFAKSQISPSKISGSNQQSNINTSNKVVTNPLATQTQQAQQQARDNQARADQDAQRKGKRSHDPAAEASDCLSLDKTGLYGGFVNSCAYKVDYVFCNANPKPDSWADMFNCEKKNGIGAWQVGANRTSASHTRNTTTVYWFACKSPATVAEAAFVVGKGIEARCR